MKRSEKKGKSVSISLMLILGALMFLAFDTSAQKLDKERVSFSYYQLPFSPIPHSTENYQVEFIMPYKSMVYNQMKEWERKCELKELIYKKQLAEYNKEMERIRKGGKYIKMPIEPTLEYPEKPTHKKIYVQTDMEDKIDLAGYNLLKDDAIIIKITCRGFEYQQPEIKTSTKTVNSQRVTTYYSKLAYRIPLELEVILPDGQRLIDETFGNTEKWTYETSNKEEYEIDLPYYSNKNDYLEQLGDKLMERQMKDINAFLNSNYGYQWVRRSATLFKAKGRKHNYDSYNKGFYTLKIGLETMEKDMTAGTRKINEALDIFEDELQDIDLDNKKARISRDVALGTYINISEGLLWLGDYDQALAWLDKVLSLDPSNKEMGWYTSQREFILNIKVRDENNQ